MKIEYSLAESLMFEALEEAKKAKEKEEVPIGAVIYYENKIIARGHNNVEKEKRATSHAEILVIEQASKHIGDWRLSDCILCVTLEPCTMCLGAIKQSRIPCLIFGTRDPEKGACGSIYDLCNNKLNSNIPRVISGIKEEECSKILKEFFKERRNK